MNDKKEEHGKECAAYLNTTVKLIFKRGIYRAAIGTLKVESLHSVLDVYVTKFAADIRFPESHRTTLPVSKLLSPL